MFFLKKPNTSMVHFKQFKSPSQTLWQKGPQLPRVIPYCSSGVQARYSCSLPKPSTENCGLLGSQFTLYNSSRVSRVEPCQLTFCWQNALFPNVP